MDTTRSPPPTAAVNVEHNCTTHSLRRESFNKAFSWLFGCVRVCTIHDSRLYIVSSDSLPVCTFIYNQSIVHTQYWRWLARCFSLVLGTRISYFVFNFIFQLLLIVCVCVWFFNVKQIDFFFIRSRFQSERRGLRNASEGGSCVATDFNAMLMGTWFQRVRVITGIMLAYGTPNTKLLRALLFYTVIVKIS